MIQNPSASLATWSSRVVELDEAAAWPGPRPFGHGDPVELLVGRPGDSNRFRNLVQENRLVVLDGESGVGKSSLLGKALLPELEDVGLSVALANNWSDGSSFDTPTLVSELVRKALETRGVISREVIESLEQHSGLFFFGELNKLFGRNCVVILDQFEELIRHSGERAESVIDLVLMMNKHLDIRIIISLRSEFVHKLRRLQTNAQPYTMSSYSLKPIPPTAAQELITAPNGLANRTIEAIDASAARGVAAIWNAATTAEDGSARPDAPGVLMLQALLFVLDSDARDGRPLDEEVTVDEAVLDAFTSRVPRDNLTEREWSERVLETALSEAVRVKLDRCETVARDLDVDHYLIEGARLYAARCAPHLSSAGYKLLREADELANTVLGSELGTLKKGIAKIDQTIDSSFDHVKRDLLTTVLRPLVSERPDARRNDQHSSFDLLTASASRLAGEVEAPARPELGGGTSADLLLEWLELRKMSPGLAGGDPDPASATCGPLMGLSPTLALIEEHRRFAFALAWLSVSQIVRLTSPSPDQTIVALVHDRFGTGVNMWSDTVGGTPRDSFAAITSPKGVDLFWTDLDAENTDLVAPEGGRVRLIPNLRWRGGWVKGSFRNVAFVNCDLRGTMFEQSRFEGVAFVNCLLDGSMFSDCTMVGSVPQPSARTELDHDWEDQDGRFWFDATKSDGPLVDSWCRHRHGTVEREHIQFLSPGAGTSVTISDSEPGPDLRQLWSGGSGGLAFYGGRISTFVVRTPTFEARAADGAGIALRFVAGSGLDFVELDEGASVEITGSAIRNLTFSPALHQRAEAAPKVDITVEGSALAQLWLSPGLVGSVSFEDSRAVQLWNESSVEIDLDGLSTGYDFVDWSASTPQLHRQDQHGLERLLAVEDDVRSFRIRTQRMDYVRDPRRLTT